MKRLITSLVALTFAVPSAHANYTPEPPANTQTQTPATKNSPTPSPGSTPSQIAPAATVQSELARIIPMVDSYKYAQARTELLLVDKDFPNNANVNNLLGYTSRKLKMYSSSATYYSKALKIDPNHLGALEYQGELFVVTNKISMARKNLKKLEKLCGVNCVEYKDLKAAIGKKK